MDFKTRRIRKEPRVKKIRHEATTERRVRVQSIAKNPHLYAIGGGIAILFLLLFGIYQIVRSLDFSSIVFSFGKPLLTDDSGHTNIMLVGIGGGDHDGSDLTDTIIVASIDYDKKIVPMVSIPRDFYIEKGTYSQERINAVYHSAKSQLGDKDGLQALKNKVSEITGLPIQYYVKIDFNGFKKIVDSIGGVDVVVENAIYDPSYPKGETIYYETFKIDAGPQHLDGETALKFARSRKTTSDFDRAKRQQQLLYAIRDKTLSMNILTDTGKIKELYDSLGESIDTNLSLAEIIELGKLSKDISKDKVMPIVINDDPTSCGGLVYTPAREYFSGAAVLLPAGNNFDYVHFFLGTVIPNMDVVLAQDQIQILNGTKVSGLAYEGMNTLSRFCLNVVYYGNAENRDLDESTLYYKPAETEDDDTSTRMKTIEMIKALMPGLKVQEGIPPEYLSNEKRQNATIVVELGKDYLVNRLKDPFDSLRYFIPPKPQTQETTETATEAATETTAVTE